MAVGVIGVERDVGHDRKLRHRRLDRPDRPVRQVVGVPGLLAELGLQRHIGIGKEADRGNAEVMRLLRGLHDPVDRPAHNTGHGDHGLLHPLAIAHEDRPDQVVDRKLRLAHEVAQAGGGPGAAESAGGVGGLVDGHEHGSFAVVSLGTSRGMGKALPQYGKASGARARVFASGIPADRRLWCARFQVRPQDRPKDGQHPAWISSTSSPK
jgi:hypothetical protein